MKHKKSAYFRIRKLKMMAEDPHCHWCGCEVVFIPSRGQFRKPDNYATIDHLVSRYSGPRPDPKFRKKTLVLACNKCNEERQLKETVALPKEELWRRSGSYPLGHPLARDKYNKNI